jgi:hypothetical protein
MILYFPRLVPKAAGSVANSAVQVATDVRLAQLVVTYDSFTFTSSVAMLNDFNEVS